MRRVLTETRAFRLYNDAAIFALEAGRKLEALDPDDEEGQRLARVMLRLGRRLRSDAEALYRLEP